MTTDFNLRVYQPNKGNHPMILTKKVSDMQHLYNGHKPVDETLRIRKYDICENSENPFQETLRYKQVRKPSSAYYAVPCYINSEDSLKKGSARKVIYRSQPNTNNMTQIAIDFIEDEGKAAESITTNCFNYGGKQKVVELTRDLKDGDVFELLARQDKSGKVVADKLALKSGKVIENIPEFFQKLAKELDPLAKNWIKKVLIHLI